MAYGLTAEGFSRPGFQDIRQELEADFRAELGPDAVVQGGKWGRLIDVLTERFSLVWEAMQGVHDSRTPKGAFGVPLDDLCSITGTVRESPRKSVALLTITGVEGTTVPSGFTVRTVSTAVRFQTTVAATIGAGGTVADVRAESENYGPVAAQAGTLTQIVTAYAGVTAVTNPADVELGADIEKDPPLRIRRESEIRGSGAAAPDAIRAKLLRVGEGTDNPVLACKIFENTTSEVDVDGMPAKSVEAVVQGGTDADVALALWRCKAAGIYTHGSVVVAVVDAAGDSQTVRFSRPTELAIYVVVTVKKGPKWPTVLADSDALVLRIKESVAAYDADLDLGDEVVRNFLFGSVLVEGPEFIADVPILYIGTAPAPTGTANIQPTSRQRANLDTSRVDVTLV